MAGKKDDRARLWCAEIYDDSAPQNWRELLDDQHIAWCESPYHCFDTKETGELKKPHYHIILDFDGNKSYNQVMEILTPLGCNIALRVQSRRGMTRYLAHLDNPEKYQYNVDDIIPHGGYDLSILFEPSQQDRLQIVRDITNFVYENNITEFIDLAIYASNYRPNDWFPVIVDNNAYYFGQIIKSRRYLKEKA